MNYFTHKLLLVALSSILTGLSTHCMKSLRRPSLEMSNDEKITPDTLPKELWRTIVFLALEDELNIFRYSTTLQGHTEAIISIEYSPDGKTAITRSEDYTVRLWDIVTGQQLQAFTGHTDCIYSAAYSPDGKTVITGSNDKTVRL